MTSLRTETGRRLRISEALNYALEVTFTFFDLDERNLTASGPSDGHTVTDDHISSDRGEDDDLLPLKETVLNLGVEAPQRCTSSSEESMGKSDVVLVYLAEADCTSALTPPPRGQDRVGFIDSNSSVIHSNNETSISDGQGGEQFSFSTPPTSEAGSEVRYDA